MMMIYRNFGGWQSLVCIDSIGLGRERADGGHDGRTRGLRKAVSEAKLFLRPDFVHSVHHELRNLVIFPDCVLRLLGHCLTVKYIVICDKAV
jgi:hypothetical protein